MKWFKSPKTTALPAAPVSPVYAFWSWWAGSAKDQFAAAIASGAWGDLPQKMSEHVHAIHPDLQWELSSGTRAQHTLCVTGAGTAELRPLSQRWKRAAPPEDPVWQYEPARTRDATVEEANLELDGHSLDLGQTVVDADLDEHRLRYNVVIHHSQFVRMDERQRQQFTFLVLDWALGEDDVERWIGAVEASVISPAAGQSVTNFVETVDALAAQPVEETWVMMQGQDPEGLPVMAMARRPLRWIDSPLLDLHNKVGLTYQAEPNGLPTGESLAWLRELEVGRSRWTGRGAARPRDARRSPGSARVQRFRRPERHRSHRRVGQCHSGSCGGQQLRPRLAGRASPRLRTSKEVGVESPTLPHRVGNPERSARRPGRLTMAVHKPTVARSTLNDRLRTR